MPPLTILMFGGGGPNKSWRVAEPVDKPAFAPEQIKLLSIGAEEFGNGDRLVDNYEGRIDPQAIARIVPKKQGVNITYCVWLAVQLGALVVAIPLMLAAVNDVVSDIDAVAADEVTPCAVARPRFSEMDGLMGNFHDAENVARAALCAFDEPAPSNAHKAVTVLLGRNARNFTYQATDERQIVHAVCAVDHPADLGAPDPLVRLERAYLAAQTALRFYWVNRDNEECAWSGNPVRQGNCAAHARVAEHVEDAASGAVASGHYGAMPDVPTIVYRLAVISIVAESDAKHNGGRCLGNSQGHSAPALCSIAWEGGDISVVTGAAPPAPQTSPPPAAKVSGRGDEFEDYELYYRNPSTQTCADRFAPTQTSPPSPPPSPPRGLLEFQHNGKNCTILTLSLLAHARALGGWPSNPALVHFIGGIAVFIFLALEAQSLRWCQQKVGLVNADYSWLHVWVELIVLHRQRPELIVVVVRVPDLHRRVRRRLLQRVQELDHLLAALRRLEVGVFAVPPEVSIRMEAQPEHVHLLARQHDGLADVPHARRLAQLTVRLVLALVDLQKDQPTAWAAHHEVDVRKLLLAMCKLAAERAAVVEVHLAHKLAWRRSAAALKAFGVPSEHQRLLHRFFLALAPLATLGGVEGNTVRIELCLAVKSSTHRHADLVTADKFLLNTSICSMVDIQHVFSEVTFPGRGVFATRPVAQESWLDIGVLRSYVRFEVALHSGNVLTARVLARERWLDIGVLHSNVPFKTTLFGRYMIATWPSTWKSWFDIGMLRGHMPFEVDLLCGDVVAAGVPAMERWLGQHCKTHHWPHTRLAPSVYLAPSAPH